MLIIILLYSLCASMFTISKYTLFYSQPIFFIAIRMLGAGIMLCGYYVIKHNWKKESLRALIDWRLFLPLVLFHIYITYICDLCALKQLTSLESAFLYNLSPFLSAIFSYIWFSEVMTPKKWLGLLIGFSSLIPQYYGQDIGLSYKTIPLIITFIAVVSSAYGWVVFRKLVKDKSYSPIFVNGISMFLGGLGALVTSLIFEQWQPTPVSDWYKFLKGTVLIILVAHILFYNIYGYLLKKYTATFLSFAGILCPLFTAILGWFFLEETVTITFFVSCGLIAMGLSVFYHEELRQGYVSK